MRKPYFVRNQKHDQLFRSCSLTKHMVVVVDEYGYCRNHHRRDLLEEIVGNIFDEYDDEEEHKYEKVDESTYLFDGSISLEQVSALIKVSLPIEEYETLSGYVISQLGKIRRRRSIR